MEIGIIGLPKSGKTTLFNTLTRGRAETRAFGAKAAEPNVGIVRVPDKRLEGLQSLLKPKRLVAAEVKYVDVAVSSDKKGGWIGPARSHLTTTDALIDVARAFTPVRQCHRVEELTPGATSELSMVSWYLPIWP